MDGAVVLLPLGSPLRQPARILHLVEQNVTASAVFGDDRQGAGVAGDQDLPVGGLKEVRIAFQRAVADGQGSHPDRRILVDHAGHDLGHSGFVAFGVGLLEAVDPEVDVHGVGLLDVVGHGAETLRPKDLQGGLPLQHPWGKQQVGVPGGVVGVQMGAERDLEIFGVKGGNAILIGAGTLADDAGAEIHQIGMAVHHHRRGRPTGKWLCVGGAGAQQNKLCLTHHAISSFRVGFPFSIAKGNGSVQRFGLDVEFCKKV